MEQGLTIRFGQVISGRIKKDEHGRRYFLVGEESQGEGWLILTNQGIRWHYPEDGIPALDRGKRQAWGVEGYRFAPFLRLLGASSKPQEIEIKGPECCRRCVLPHPRPSGQASDSHDRLCGTRSS
jgi:hypothetical protein